MTKKKQKKSSQPKRKLTAAEKRARKARKEKYQWIFMNGKQVRVKREPMINGMPVDEFIRANADPMWLHQNGMWEFMEPEPDETKLAGGIAPGRDCGQEREDNGTPVDQVPF
jgi:hypothetical protein